MSNKNKDFENSIIVGLTIAKAVEVEFERLSKTYTIEAVAAGTLSSLQMIEQDMMAIAKLIYYVTNSGGPIPSENKMELITKALHGTITTLELMHKKHFSETTDTPSEEQGG